MEYLQGGDDSVSCNVENMFSLLLIPLRDILTRGIMKNKYGVYWLFIGLASIFFLTSSLAAADKVVVIPLGGNNTSGGTQTYTGEAPVIVDNINYTVGLNTATDPGDLMTWDGNNWIAQQPATQHFSLNNMQPYLGIYYIIALQGTYPSRNSVDPFLAEISMFAGNFAPRGWAHCNGQLLAISQNTAVFSLVGTTYGGDGRTTFALPDLRGRIPLHPGQGPGLTNRRLGERGGTEEITR